MTNHVKAKTFTYRLNRIINKLFQWEMDFHDDDPIEVLKCWRLHLGSCDILKEVIAAHDYQDNNGYNAMYNKVYLPLKTKWRHWRTSDQAPKCVKGFLHGCAWIYNVLFFTMRPFLGASALYFDIFKDIAFAYLIWNSVDVLTKGDFTQVKLRIII